MDNRIFIERARHTGIRRIDKKRNLIHNQKVVWRRPLSRNHPQTVLAARKGDLRNLGPGCGRKGDGRKSDDPRESAGALGRFLVSNRRTLLWVSMSLIVLASLIPLYINLQSFFWEKRWSVDNEKEPLYDLFLNDGAAGFGESKGNTPSGADPRGIPGVSPEGTRGFYPETATPVPSFTVKEYAVRPGDSLFGIAARFGVPVDGIISASGLKSARYLQPGVVLRIPSMKGIVYRVKHGDNLSRIALRYGLSVNTIADINDLSSETIRPGQELFLPGASLSEWERAIAFGSFFKSPARGRITSKVGFRIDPFTGKMAYHAGVDFSGLVGTAVRAAQYGRVIFTGDYGGYGKTVIIVHPDGYRTLYAHLHRISVKRGQAVKMGEKIGLTGNTGRSTGPHLHFEVHRYNKVIDPLKVMKIR